jgi:glycosyltransferase involved in cell wall biosynthesis
MLIVQITLNYFSRGAVMLRARQETKALLNAGHRVVVITDLRHYSQLHYFDGLKKKPEIIPVKTILIYGLRSISNQLIFTFKAYYALKELSRKEKIDLIVEHSASPYASARFSKFKIAPTVWVIHDLIKDRIATGNPYNRIETLFQLQAYNYSYQRVNFLIPTSLYSKKLLLMDGAKSKNIYIKYNTVNTLIFFPDEKIEKNIDVLFIGRFSIEKGADILIDATRYLSNKKRIVLIGDGTLRNDLIEQAKTINQDITFTGWIPFNELPYYIRRSKLVVAPSRSECHASVPLESMACGVPVIASQVSGMEDSIENNKSGWLLNQNNAESLGKLINEVISDESKLKKASKEAIKRAEIFSEKRFTNEIVEFYEMLVRKYKS